MTQPIVGHEQVVTALTRQSLPPVTLLLGPRSVGKWSLAEYLAVYHQVMPADLRQYPAPLTVDVARQVGTFFGTAPFGHFKLVLIGLDNASDAAHNALLKTLEEPPDTARIILTSNSAVPATVLSRCTTYRLGLLTLDQLTEVLLRHGLSEYQARTSALCGGGQVDVAVSTSRNTGSRQAVLGVLRAIATTDPLLFDLAFKGWDEPCAELLAHWICEAMTGTRLVFTDLEFYGLQRHPQMLRDMLIALSRAPDARTRIGVRAALQPFLHHT